MARILVASDNFNRAALGADWAQLNSDNGEMTIDDSTVVTGTSFGNHGAGRWVGAGTFTNDQYASLLVNQGYTGTSNYGIGVICRASADTNAARDYYFAHIADVTYLGKVVNGTITTLHSSGSPSWTSGDRIELEVEGTTLRLCKNGTPLGGSFTQTDVSLSTGFPGVLGIGDPADLAEGDDWEGGNIGTVAAPNNYPHANAQRNRRHSGRFT